MATTDHVQGKSETASAEKAAEALSLEKLAATESGLQMPPQKIRAAIVEEVFRLLREEPGRWAAHIYRGNQDFYEVMLRVGTILTTRESGQCMVQLFYGKERESGRTKLEIDLFTMRPVSPGVLNRHECVYRMDITGGPAVTEEFERISKLRSIGVSQQTLDALGYMEWQGGSMVRLSSQWAETVLTDAQVLQGLMLVKSLSLPDMRNWHGTWQEMCETRGADTRSYAQALVSF